MSNKKVTARIAALDVISKVGEVVHGVVQFQVCGSIRREKLYVGDADLVVDELHLFDMLMFSNKAVTRGLTDVFCLSENYEPRVSKRADYRINDVPFNVYESSIAAWGAMSLFLTGSALFNVRMRAKAKEKGMKLNQYGLWRGEELVVSRTEEQIFNELRISYVSPRERE